MKNYPHIHLVIVVLALGAGVAILPAFLRAPSHQQVQNENAGTLSADGEALPRVSSVGGRAEEASAGFEGGGAGVPGVGSFLTTNISSRFVGFGARWDESVGDFVPTKPATLPITLDTTPIPQGGGFDVITTSQSSSLSELERTQLQSSLNVYSVKASAVSSRRNARTIDRAGASFSAIKYRDYEPIALSLQDLVNLEFTPEAEAILSLPNETQRGRLWREAYGEFMIIGYTLRHEVGLRVSASRFESYSATETLVQLEASVGGYFNAEADWGQMAESALAQESLDLSAYYIGTERIDFQLPTTLSELNDPDHPASKNKLIANIDALLADNETASPGGVLLFPWDAVVFELPDLDEPNLQSAFLSLASTAAEEARSLLTESEGYAAYPEFRRLLRLQEDGAGNSILGELDDTRLQVKLALDELWVAVNGFLLGGGTDQILDAIDGLNDALGLGAAYGLEDVILAVRTIEDRLPPIAIELRGNRPFPYNTSGGGRCGWWLFTGTIKNAAFLSDVGYGDIWFGGLQPRAEMLGNPLEYRVFIRQFGPHGDPYCNRNILAHEKNIGGLGIRNPNILAVRPSQAPGAAGLYDVDFALSAATSSAADRFEVTIVDDLSRQGMTAFDTH